MIDKNDHLNKRKWKYPHINGQFILNKGNMKFKEERNVSTNYDGTAE